MKEKIEFPRGWVLYDGDCSFCVDTAARFAGYFKKIRHEPLPLQTPGWRERFGLSESDWLKEVRVVTAEGLLYGGAAALAYLARQSRGGRPVGWLLSTPWGYALLDRLYKAVARRRLLGRSY